MLWPITRAYTSGGDTWGTPPQKKTWVNSPLVLTHQVSPPDKVWVPLIHSFSSPPIVPNWNQFVFFNPLKVPWNWIAFYQNSLVISPGLLYHAIRRESGRPETSEASGVVKIDVDTHISYNFINKYMALRWVNPLNPPRMDL